MVNDHGPLFDNLRTLTVGILERMGTSTGHNIAPNALSLRLSSIRDVDAAMGAQMRGKETCASSTGFLAKIADNPAV